MESSGLLSATLIQKVFWIFFFFLRPSLAKCVSKTAGTTGGVFDALSATELF